MPLIFVYSIIENKTKKKMNIYVFEIITSIKCYDFFWFFIGLILFKFCGTGSSNDFVLFKKGTIVLKIFVVSLYNRIVISVIF